MVPIGNYEGDECHREVMNDTKGVVPAVTGSVKWNVPSGQMDGWSLEFKLSETNESLNHFYDSALSPGNFWLVPLKFPGSINEDQASQTCVLRIQIQRKIHPLK